MKEEMLTISKEELIEILTKGNIFYEDGIEFVLSKDGLSGVLRAVMCKTNSLVERTNDLYEEIEELKNGSKGEWITMESFGM